MKYQRLISLTALLSFIVLTLSSGVLYLVPDRGATSWSGWTFLALDKATWDNLHINIGLLFIVIIIWHIYYNWKPIKNYLKVKRELKIFTKEFNASLLLTTLFVIGTITMTLPFSFFVNFGNGMKAMHLKDGENPPFTYAEYVRFKDFCKISHLDINQSKKALLTNNIKINSINDKLSDIASLNNITPKKIYMIIKDHKQKLNLPLAIPVGIAHKSILKLQRTYNIDSDKFIKYLQQDGHKAKIDMSFKKISKINNLHPAELYGMLVASQK